MNEVRQNVIGSPINQITWSDAVNTLALWGEQHESRVVCICNAHSVVTAKQDQEFNQVLKHADMSTPDGAPVAWMIKKVSGQPQARINGPDLMLKYCEHAEKIGQSIYLYGGQESTLNILVDVLKSKYPNLKIAGYLSPPFRELNAEEKQKIIQDINNSGAHTVWVGLGCPKQEKWMHEHKGKINAVMVGVGAAFDYHAGTIKRAPKWMQNSGLEWFHRLCSEPKRLWRRYLVTNTLFILYAAKQLMSK
ncbi:WecB/TagA/CpsF family glycosyltransferase [Acinetobacter schindleri]|uniref:WecB/TagA/CpsF family glycosyltransferase n=1 Tax=Acinetobacter schindleri TaxID=108981 RepID=UPI003F57D0A7